MAQAQKPAATDPLGELKKMIEQVKLPGIDMNSIAEARRKDVEALLAANKVTAEAMQELARKQGEMFTGAMQGLQATVQAMGDPTRQSELARKAYEKAVAEMNVMARLAQKAQADSIAAITERAQQSVDELKKLLQTK